MNRPCRIVSRPDRSDEGERASIPVMSTVPYRTPRHGRILIEGCYKVSLFPLKTARVAKRIGKRVCYDSRIQYEKRNESIGHAGYRTLLLIPYLDELLVVLVVSSDASYEISRPFGNGDLSALTLLFFLFSIYCKLSINDYRLIRGKSTAGNTLDTVDTVGMF